MAEQVGAVRDGAAGRGRARGIPACYGMAVGLGAARLDGTAWGRQELGAAAGGLGARPSGLGAALRGAAGVGSPSWDRCCRDPLGADPAGSAAASLWASGKAEPRGDRNAAVRGSKVQADGMLA